ncbi:hypothetical protein IQ241_05740 [Romeria aff. gracilis LEGE 07310]|uniref:Uncharacterized protein n=1 Tax=Vasconcelosia minhoensis LEGE 07310 TaxID=915328 RepID=A0A8J7AM70_9CYAN|nr:NB-ARC domain-containing protein [Romeria gracilis]MBE9076801.1 hypothetical protein [Romeria aff. gracilis LEGE 07310]
MDIEEALALVEGAIERGRLTQVQKLVFRHAWEGLSYEAIARATGYDTGYIKDVGSKLWRCLSSGLGESVTKFNFQAVLKRHHQQKAAESTAPSSPDSTALSPGQDWGEAVDASHFYGRASELERLSQWITQEQCRLVAILGMGGVGKTSLSVRLAEQVQPEFQLLYWRSLRDTPPFDCFLAALLQFLAQGQNGALPESRSARLTLLIESLRTVRCLLVLDNFDALFEAGQPLGTYRAGYADYGELLQRVGESRHQSSLLITSREKPLEVSILQGEETRVRALQLRGLPPADAEPLLQAKGIRGADGAMHQLIERYQGNPLALKITATSICDLFGGNITSFLEQDIAVFNGICQLLKRQIERISTLEETVMYWLAINRAPVSIAELLADMAPSVSAPVLLEALESLRGRSLIEQTSQGFTQQPVMMEYVTGQLIERFCAELTHSLPNGPTPFLKRFALLKATAKDYIRKNQIHIIVAPLVTQAEAQAGSEGKLIDLIIQRIQYLQQAGPAGYAVGNLINLLTYLQVDLSDFDFSYCQIWQADFVKANLLNTDLTCAQVRRSVFAETFGGVSCTAYRSDGQWLATSDTSGEVQIWDVSSYQQITAFRVDAIWTWAAAFAPQSPLADADAAILATGGDDRLVKLWDASTGRCLRSLPGHTNTINAIAFHPQGKLLASCSQDATIRLWQLDDPHVETVPCQVLEGHQGRVWSAAFSPDGKLLVSGSEDCTLKRWNLESMECDRTFVGHQSWVKTVAISPDGQSVASGSFNGTLKLWDLSTGECLHSWPGHPATVTMLAFSPNGQLLASSSYDQTVKVWQVSTQQCVRTLREHGNRVWSVAFSPDGQQLASGSDDHATRLWDLKTGHCAKTWKGHTNGILSLSFKADGQWLATGHEDQTIKLWNPQSGEVVRTLRGHANRAWSVAFAPPTAAYETDTLLASGSGDRTVKLWNAETGQCLSTLQGHTAWVWSVAFHPYQPWLASCSLDRTIRLYAAQSEQCIQILEGHQDTVWTIRFSPDGRWLASGSYDQTVKLWDLSTGTCCHTFAGHTGPVVALAFRPDGRTLLSGGFDRAISVWDLETGQSAHTFQGHTELVSAIAFPPAEPSANSSAPQPVFWSGSFDETLNQWSLETQTCLNTCRTPRPYDGLKITGVSGLADAQKATLKALGATEESSPLSRIPIPIPEDSALKVSQHIGSRI